MEARNLAAARSRKLGAPTSRYRPEGGRPTYHMVKYASQTYGALNAMRFAPPPSLTGGNRGGSIVKCAPAKNAHPKATKTHKSNMGLPQRSPHIGRRRMGLYFEKATRYTNRIETNEPSAEEGGPPRAHWVPKWAFVICVIRL